MIHTIDQLGASRSCAFPSHTDAVKRFGVEACKSAVSLLAQSSNVVVEITAEWIYVWKPEFFFYFDNCGK